jgi:NADH-quinone oxidoreductase subunit L
MSRQVFLVFFGEARWNEEPAAVGAAADPGADPVAVGQADTAGAATVAGTAHGPDRGAGVHPHESPWIMTVPLVVLAVLSTIGGAINLPFSPDTEFLADWLHPVVETAELEIDVTTGTQVALAVVATVVALVGIAAASAVYLRRRVRAIEPAVLAHAWYYDETISRFVAGPGTQAFEAVAWFDRNVIDGAVNGVAHLVAGAGRRLRTVQSGYVRSYALGLAAGVVVVLGYFVTRVSF